MAFALAKKAGGAITGTSANLSGHPGCSRVSDLDRRIVEETELTLDGGTLKGGAGSTVVDITQKPPRVIREGLVSTSQIRRALTTGGG